MDLVFGAPLMALIGLAPSVRAARRDLAGRKRRLQEERARQQAEQAQEAEQAVYVAPDMGTVGAPPA